jgi:type II secretory pathway predicted ATPase ExeA
MIHDYFGIKHTPFATDNICLLPQQQEAFNIILTQCQMHGLTLLIGQPGTGKTIVKEALKTHDTKRIAVPVISRTLHTYHSILRILCEAFQIDYEGNDHKCERKLIEEAYRLNRAGKMLAPVIDDAQYLPIEALRKIRLLFEDFPKNHNLILIAHPALKDKLQLTINQDIHSRITWTGEMLPLAPDNMKTFIHDQLDKVAMPHTAFDDQALNLIIQSAEGILRTARNLCIATLIEAVRDQTKTVTLKQVNHVLKQPHWRRQYDSTLPTTPKQQPK